MKDGKEKIENWTSLRLKLRKRFVPKPYKQELYLRLNCFQQDHLSMAEYMIEFEKLYLACGCKLEEEQKMAKFLFGMNKPIANLVELQTYNTFGELCLSLQELKHPIMLQRPKLWTRGNMVPIL